MMPRKKVPELTAQQRRRRWIRDYNRIKDDVISLLANYRLYRDLAALAARSPIAHHQSYFWTWYQDTYAHAALVAMRRICEHDVAKKPNKRERTISLDLLLSDMMDHNDVLSLKWYIQRHPDKNRPEGRHIAISEFQSTWGKGSTRVPKRAFRGDLRSLRKAVKPIKAYVDQRIAHRDRKPTAPSKIKVKVFEDATVRISEITKKYGALLTGWSHILEGDIGPWRSIFRQPWIKDRGGQ